MRVLLFLVASVFTGCTFFSPDDKISTLSDFQKAVDEENIPLVNEFLQKNNSCSLAILKAKKGDFSSFGEMTPLEYAIFYKKAKVVSFLLKKGEVCDVEAMGDAFWSTGNTESHSYTKEDMIQTLMVIVEHNPNLLKDSQFCEVMMLGAVNYPDADILAYLLNQGVSPNIKSDGWTLLDYALANGFAEGARLLRQHGATASVSRENLYPI